jgi:predicted flavoprotein YhiN
VLVLDHSERVAEKIRISGGGRCNFTNRDLDPRRAAQALCGRQPAVSAARRCRATRRRTSFALVQKHGIAFHEKHKGQLFADRSAEDIIQMLLAECAARRRGRAGSLAASKI